MTESRERLVRKLLEKIASEQQYHNPEIETAAIPPTGANFTSQIFNATIKSKDKKDLNLFAKTAVLGESLRDQFGNIFKIEKHFYTDLSKNFQKLEIEHNVLEEHRLIVPKYYGNSENYLREVMVFEDISKDGFVTHDRMESVDWNYASKAIEQLAKFHALSLALRKERPTDYENALNTYKEGKLFKENGPVDELLTHTKSQTLHMTKEENKPKVEKFLEKCVKDKVFIDITKSKRRPVIIHADFRPSNLMHKVDEDGNLQIVILDLQTLSEGSVAVDLLYFLVVGSDATFRTQYYDQLIEHYYENLSAALRRLHLDPEEVFPRADFDEELREMLPFGLMIAGITLPTITLNLDDVSTKEDGAFENDDLGVMKEMTAVGSSVCVKRLNEVIDDYVRWGVI